MTTQRRIIDNITPARKSALVIDTRDGLDFVRVLAMRSALNLEVRTGMKMSRGVSVVKLVNQRFGTTFRHKLDALVFLNEVLADFDAK